MTAKVLTPMGEVVHCSTYRSLTPQEFADAVEQGRLKRTAEEKWGLDLARGQLTEFSLDDTP